MRNEIFNSFEEAFNCKVIGFTATNKSNFDFYNHLLDNYCEIQIKVVELTLDMLKDKVPFSIRDLYSGSATQVLNKFGVKLMALSTEMSHHNYVTTTLEFKCIDIDTFVKALQNVGWGKYSQEFDQVIEEELSKD